jgi:uncharacterized membrane protein YccC
MRQSIGLARLRNGKNLLNAIDLRVRHPVGGLVAVIFAAKTTGSGLLALLVAFTFNLDQPKWALLTVFIVAQPQSGLVLAKSFYRIIGTLTGAASALILVSLFAQERVLFLGTLAIWVGLCTFASKYARHFAAYGFVLAGYTVAIVGLPGAQDPGNAFFIAVARVTEVSLGIMSTAVISHVVFPLPLAATLRRAVVSSRTDVADYATMLLRGCDTAPTRAKLLDKVMAIENLRASALFEDAEIRGRSFTLRHLDAAMLSVVEIGYLLGRSWVWLRDGGTASGRTLRGVVAVGSVAIDHWGADRLSAGGLGRRLRQAGASLPVLQELDCEPRASEETVIRHAATNARLRELFSALVAFAEAHEAFLSPDLGSSRPLRLSVSNDSAAAVWAGLRAALAVILVGAFWLLAAWPDGVTATIIAGVVTARLATMDHAVKAALSAAFVFVLAALPCFVAIEMLLPNASGFAMFACVVAPMLFCCAYLMANLKTAGIGFLAGLFFASIGAFQDTMTYDPVAFVNTTIALAIAAATGGVLFAVVAPGTPQSARSRFLRNARAALARISQRRPRINLAEFETVMTDALDQLRGGLQSDRRADAVAIETGCALLVAGRELIRVRDDGRPTCIGIEIERDVVRFLATRKRPPLDRALQAAEAASVRFLAELRDEQINMADAQEVARRMVAFATVRDELEHCGRLLLDETAKGEPDHVA